MLVFESQNPQELLKEVAEYLRQCAAREKNSADHARTLREGNTYAARANALASAAIDLEAARANPPKAAVVLIPAGELIDVPHDEDDEDIHEGQPPYDEDVPEADEPPACPVCSGPGVLLGTLGTRVHYRCRNCGMDFSHT